jgi:hypothetical protein
MDMRIYCATAIQIRGGSYNTPHAYLHGSGRPRARGVHLGALVMLFEVPPTGICLRVAPSDSGHPFP